MRGRPPHTTVRRRVGYTGIRNRLNERHEPGPRGGAWSTSGVAELVNRRSYVTGEFEYGRTKRSRKRGAKRRLQRAEAEIIKQQNDVCKIVSPDLWDRAHARIEAYNATRLRAARGRLVGNTERSGSKYLLSGYLLSGLLACGVCGGNMVATKRGRANQSVFICYTRFDKGEAACSNNTTVPMALLDDAAVTSLRDTFSEESFTKFLEDRAEDADTRARQEARRQHLLAVVIPDLAKTEARIQRRIAMIEDDSLVAGLQKDYRAARERP